MQEPSNTLDSMRSEVAKTYARATAPTGGARLAGYRDEDLSALPPGAAEEFFGCGNPLAFAEVAPGQTVLDLGSGAGVDLVLAGRAVGPEGRVIGVDMTAPMIHRARRNVAAAGLTNVEVRQGLIEELPVDSGSVDWVISNCVVSLSPEKDRVFREVARVLKPGGRMLISDIVVDDMLAFLLARIARWAPSIGSARTEAHYLSALTSAGLVDVAVKSRFVYEADHLVGLFGAELTGAGASSGCPVASVEARVAGSAVARAVVAAAAKAVSGRVTSSKFYARREGRR